MAKKKKSRSQKKKSAWDEACKIWMNTVPDALVSWLSRGKATFIQALPNELNDVNLRMDGFLLVKIFGEECFYHLEFQTYYEEEMSLRVAGYNVGAFIQHKKPVLSFVIRLMPGPKEEPSSLEVKMPDGEQIFCLSYRLIEMYRIPATDLLSAGQVELLPFLSLTSGGDNREMVQYMNNQLEQHGTPDLQEIGHLLASFVFQNRPDDLHWLKGLNPMLQEVLRTSPLWQEVFAEDHKRWLAEGREEERNACLRDTQSILSQFVQARFPALDELARRQMQAITDPSLLNQLFLQMTLAPDEEKARQALLAVKAAPSKRKRQHRKNKREELS
jgi:hypothetical protein